MRVKNCYQLFFQIIEAYLVTYVKLTCQTKIHGGTGRATTGPCCAHTGPKSQKTLEGHISLKTCPNRAFEVFLASTFPVDAKKHLKRPIWTSFE